MNTFCTTCGAAIEAGKSFCSKCGAKLPTQFTATQQYAQVQPQYSKQQPAQPQQFNQQAFKPQTQQQQQYTKTPPQYAPPPPQYAPPPSTQFAAPPPPSTQFAPVAPQYAAPPQATGAFTDMQTVLAQAPGALNMPNRPWAVTIEGTSIVARWKWMDAAFFAPHEVTNETRQYTFTVALNANGKWKEIDTTANKSTGVKMSGGKIGFGTSSNSFKGKTSQKSFGFGMGHNNQTGETGLISYKFDTTSVKQPIRDYLSSRGWKKA